MFFAEEIVKLINNGIYVSRFGNFILISPLPSKNCRQSDVTVPVCILVVLLLLMIDLS